MNTNQHIALQESNAKLLQKLFDRSGLKVEGEWHFRKLQAEGYMPLSIDRLGRSERGFIFFALAHNSVQNGDVMADPDMEVVFIPGDKPRLRALHYQNDYARVFRTTASMDHQQSLGEPMQVSSDQFLELWLRNLLDQGHRLPEEQTT